MFMFTPPSIKFLLDVFLELKRENKAGSFSMILPFFRVPIIRVNAALKIQACFRSYRVRKIEKAKLWHTPINSLLPTIISQRAVTYIQIWWKYFKLRKRIKALKSIQVYLTKIKEPFLYIEE